MSLNENIELIKKDGYDIEVKGNLFHWYPKECGEFLTGIIVAKSDPEIAIIQIITRDSDPQGEYRNRKSLIMTNDDYELRLMITQCKIGDNIAIVLENCLDRKYKLFKKTST